MSDELNPLTLGETPEEYIELDDGSVEIPIEGEALELEDSDFLENLAERFSEEELTLVGSELCELIEKDKKSREKRDKQYEEGLRRTGLGDDAPGGAEFEGASKVVHPVLAEACVDFSSRAIKELFPASGPVKPWVNGDITPQKLERAGRKTRHMNWQLTTQIKEYRDELEQLLTQLPMGGSQYQKFWRDTKKKRTRCEFIPVDEVFIPYAASGFYNAQRVTHRQLISRATFRNRVRSGLYRDIFFTDTSSIPEQSATTVANDKIEGREEDGYNEDGLRAVLEVQVNYEFEDDELSGGENAPYIITIDEDTEKVLSIYRNWDEEDPLMEKLEWMVEWKFIPWRGAYAIGLPHLIGGLSAALTGSLRALLDSAHINNAPTMLKLKSGRIVGQNTQVNVTQVCEIEGPTGIDDVKKLAMAMPFNPPSPVLHQLMQDLYALAKGVVATAEDKVGQVGDRTPVGTTMALIEQGSNTYSAIHARLHESQKRALAIIHRLNAQYLEDEELVDGLVISREDYTGSMDVVPVSDPTIFSEAQRFAQSQAIMQMALQDAQNPAVPWNQVNVRRRMLKQMRIENIDELLPPEKPTVTADILTEHTQALDGATIKAAKEQDHLAHIQGHLAFLESPLQLVNPLVPPQMMLQFMQHIQEHVRLYSSNVTAAMVQQAQAEFMGGSEDSIIAAATQQAQVQLVQQLGEMLTKIGQIQQQLQQRVPQPPMPPEVQASIKIAEMDTQRKTQQDQAMVQLKGQELQARQQSEQATTAMKHAQMQFEQQQAALREQFDQFIEQLRAKQDREAEELRAQVEMMKNQHDNHQKQVTELLKNRDDNETKLIIEQIKGQLDSMAQSQQQAPSEPQIDLTPQIKELTKVLDQMNNQRTNDALTEVMQGLRATIQQMSRPKMLIKDAQGKTIGVQ